MRHHALALGAACVLTVACAHSLGAAVEVSENGSLQSLGRTREENLLAGPVRMRVLERQFRKRAEADGPRETARKWVVTARSRIGRA